MSNHCIAAHAIAIGLLPLALIAFAPRAHGSHEFPVEVVQPLVVEEGIFLSTVSYVKASGGLIPGRAVALVGQESCVIDEYGASVNRNVASILGIKTGYDPRHGTGALFGDTLCVFIDLTVLGQPPSRAWSLGAAVEATVECVLATAYRARFGWNQASQARTEAKHVQLEVRGSAQYRHLGGVFTFADLGPLPRKREF